MKSPEKEGSSSGARNIVGLGELIWDLLPEGKQLGGAPTNFAYISKLLGNSVAVASRIGLDELGREARTRLERMGINADFLQVDEEHPTGTVGVRIGERGEAHFAVNENSAWDYLQWSPSWEALALSTDAVCFGTLGQRKAQARETILKFLAAMRAEAVRVFDVNLRHSFFTPEMLASSLKLSTIVKLSSEELVAVMQLLGFEMEVEEVASARRLIERFRPKLIAVTRGEKGSLLVTEKESINHPGFRVEVKDTIGAGDAFTATLTHYYLRGAELAAASNAANRMGAWISTQAGATPLVSASKLALILGDDSENV